MPSTRTITRLALIVPLLALAACGDDDTAATATTTAATDPPTAAGPDLAAYCGIATETFEQDGPPTLEQIQAYAAAAPDDIAAPVSVVLAAFEAADGDIEAVFSDQAAVEAFDALTAFDAEACGVGEPVDPTITQIDPAATRIDVSAADYAFTADFPSASGRYSFVMTNDGSEPHLMVLVRLDDGVGLDEVMASDGATGVIAMFESNVATPGGEAIVTANLEPGNWVLVCPVPDTEGVSHAEHGMVHEFTIA